MKSKETRRRTVRQDAQERQIDIKTAPPGPPWLGAHLSVAGGYFRAAEAAAALGMNTLQIFTASPQVWPVRPQASRPSGSPCRSANAQRWASSPLDEEQVARFRAAVSQHKLYRPVAHSCYLINLAAPDVQIWRRSVHALICELRRAGQLGLSHVIVHPGASTTGDDEAGLRRVVQALDEVLQACGPDDARIMLENTAGQGTSLGWRFEHLAEIVAAVRNPEWVDVCFDTCHAFAAGYELRSAAGFRSTKRALQTTLGIAKLQAIHVNDSKRELGSRVDRHEHIGRGALGLDAFRRLLHDPDFRTIPMYLETPKGKWGDRDWDEVNLETLRRCAN